ncbi:hypothetical protein BV25DRAFT_310168 [Artomyces pyxidatus]|uniref:Uncharacterized protein n=1 Tax=Artomyces pyxidatus TaxID=48021 RepID=A0ACB8T755_9AGAM|nr:hypothetical protein BV25DRAFT_310168 [Artomyces pyxidatus]
MMSVNIDDQAGTFVTLDGPADMAHDYSSRRAVPAFSGLRCRTPPQHLANETLSILCHSNSNDARRPQCPHCKRHFAHGPSQRIPSIVHTVYVAAGIRRHAHCAQSIICWLPSVQTVPAVLVPSWRYSSSRLCLSDCMYTVAEWGSSLSLESARVCPSGGHFLSPRSSLRLAGPPTPKQRTFDRTNVRTAIAVMLTPSILRRR